MVEETGDKSTLKPPTAEELARAEHYAAMMAAVAGDDDDYDLEDAEYGEEDGTNNLEKQRRIMAAVASAANQGLDLDDIEDSEEIMRQIYEESLYFQQNQKQ